MLNIQNRITSEVYFITITVVDWVDIFTRPCYKHIILNSLSYCQQEKGLIIYAWVLMSNHLHMIIGTDKADNTSDIIRDFKKYTSKEIIKTIEADVQESRKQWLLNRFEYAGRNDKKIKNYKFWQEGYDVQEIYLNDYFEQKLTMLVGKVC